MSPQPQATRLGKDCATAGCALVILLIGACGACGGVTYRALTPVYEAFSRPGEQLGAALVRGDLEGAYRDMARSYRDQVSRADFEAYLRDHALEGGGFVFERVVSTPERRGALGRLGGKAIELVMVQGAEGFVISELRLPGGARSPGYRGRHLSLPAALAAGAVTSSDGGRRALSLASHGGAVVDGQVRLKLSVVVEDAEGQPLETAPSAEAAHEGPEADNRVVEWRLALAIPAEGRALRVTLTDLQGDGATITVRYPLVGE